MNDTINYRDSQADSAVNSSTPASQSKVKLFFGKIKEFFRKTLVGLKRRPHNIALVVYVVALLVYTLNLTSVSNTTAYIQKTPMGLCAFVSVLFSMLGFVAMINVYPKRQKPKYLMLGLFFIMMICVAICDIVYRTKLIEGINAHYATFTKPEQFTQFQTKYSYCFKVKSMLIVHIVLIAVSAALFTLAPVIGKLLKKINTSVNIEYNAQMGDIEREDD